MSYVYKPTKKNSVKNFRWASKLTEAKSYLKLVTEHFFLIGQVEYGVFALVVQALDSVIQQINHYTVDKYWENYHYPLDRDWSVVIG